MKDLHRCPRCKTVFPSDQHAGTDFVHKCDSGVNALDQEDRFAPEKSQFAGIANQLQGTDSELEGRRLSSLTDRGKNAATHETRQRYVHIDLETGRLGENP